MHAMSHVFTSMPAHMHSHTHTHTYTHTHTHTHTLTHTHTVGTGQKLGYTRCMWLSCIPNNHQEGHVTVADHDLFVHDHPVLTDHQAILKSSCTENFGF